jgi:hypothetical protein
MTQGPGRARAVAVSTARFTEPPLDGPDGAVRMRNELLYCDEARDRVPYPILPGCLRIRGRPMKPSIQLRGIVPILFALSGCATTSMAAVEKDAAAKSFASTTDQANVYVYRLSGEASSVTCPVSLDGMKLGALAVGTFAHVVAAPGPHTVSLSCVGLEGNLSFAAATGENVFIKGEPRLHWAWQFAWLWGGDTWQLLLLPMTDSEHAMQEVRRCDLIKGPE